MNTDEGTTLTAVRFYSIHIHNDPLLLLGLVTISQPANVVLRED
jgi:hypothetical protein